jgi:hypothetical protein
MRRLRRSWAKTQKASQSIVHIMSFHEIRTMLWSGQAHWRARRAGAI